MTFEEFKQTFKGREETMQDLMVIHSFDKEKAEAELDKIILQMYNESN
jgi:hypothetical protein